MSDIWIKAVLASAGVVLAAGCLTRPVSGEQPTTKETIQTAIKQDAIDRVDLLLAIDNSASMGDKQDLLASAVPALVNRLLSPNCVAPASTCKLPSDCSALGAGAQCDPAGNQGMGQCFVAGDGQACKSVPGTQPEFSAVHDMHIGIVSSSLGGGGSPDICVPPASGDTTHLDDEGHLLNRTMGGSSVANANPVSGGGGNFLAWLPSSDPHNAGAPAPNVTPYTNGQAAPLVSDFQSLVQGSGEQGCGLEAQLESWYRFLIQPDPYASITLSNDAIPRAQLDGVDTTVLKMRHDFLRPDSLVAIIQLTDEEDSWSDPLWAGGYGWVARTFDVPPNGRGLGAAARGTSECDAPNGSNDPDCVSCMFGGNKPVAGTPVAQDPNCTSCPPGAASCTPGYYVPAAPNVAITAADGVNVRYSRQVMRKRYGYDNQHSYKRYVDGLRSLTVPDRNNESHDAANYAPNRNCTNPLFAAALPDGSDTSPAALCQLAPGPRTPDLVFYAIIGGVPNELLTDSNGNLKTALSDADWAAILGNDPDHYDFSGMDPHMVQSVAPRMGLTQPTGVYGLGTDPINGREWNTLTSTAAIDLQYACTFDLPSTRMCQQGDTSCDCAPGNATTDPAGPPLCDPMNRTTQVKGKAYPQSRYQLVAKALGSQAVVASLCAKVVTGDTSAPSYGYNGAMQAIVSRLKNVLGEQCLPQPLQVASDGTVPCSVLVVYPSQTNQAAGCTDPGMSQPSASALARFDQQWIASLGDAGAGMTPPVVCQLAELQQGKDYQGASCDTAPTAGWCYVTGAANTGGCSQAIKFGASGPPSGTTVELECIESL